MTRVPTPIEKFFDRLTAWVGSVPSLVVHTLVFLGAFAVGILGYVDFDRVLLIVTTLVSLEAIYLAIFIHMTVNRQSQELHDVSEDVEEIQEEVEEISKDVEDIQEDVEEMSHDVEEIQEDVEEMSDDWDLEGKVNPESREVLQKQLREILTKLDALEKKP